MKPPPQAQPDEKPPTSLVTFFHEPSSCFSYKLFPAASLRKLAGWSGGNPKLLVELARTLKREGLVRKRTRGDGWYLATAELARLPKSPADEWLARRRLAALAPEVADCARRCAVLGTTFRREELYHVDKALARECGGGI